MEINVDDILKNFINDKNDDSIQKNWYLYNVHMRKKIK